jgi:hypothetical protein
MYVTYLRIHLSRCLKTYVVHACLVIDLQGNLEVKVEYEVRKHKAVLYDAHSSSGGGAGILMTYDGDSHEEQLRKDESRKEMYTPSPLTMHPTDILLWCMI